jgi:hypothetical protein
MEGLTAINSDRIRTRAGCDSPDSSPARRIAFRTRWSPSSDLATANGSGNPIYASPSGNFVRTSSASLATLGDYGTFTTDATGTYEGWFITESTGNARFLQGKFVFMRISLNDGGTGTTVVTRITARDSVHVVTLSSVATDSTGTGLRGSTFASDKDFRLHLRQYGRDGTTDLRSFIERDGTDNSPRTSTARSMPTM